MQNFSGALLLALLGSCATPAVSNSPTDPYRKNAGTLANSRIQFVGIDGNVYGGEEESIEVARVRYDLQLATREMSKARDTSEDEVRRAASNIAAAMRQSKTQLSASDPGMTSAAGAILGASHAHPQAVADEDFYLALSHMASVVGVSSGRLATFYLQSIERARTSGHSQALLDEYERADLACREALGENSEEYLGFLTNFKNDAYNQGQEQLAKKLGQRIEALEGRLQAARLAAAERRSEQERNVRIMEGKRESSSRFPGGGGATESAYREAMEAADAQASRFLMGRATFMASVGIRF